MPNRKYIFQGFIFHCYLSLPECICMTYGPTWSFLFVEITNHHPLVFCVSCFYSFSPKKKIRETHIFPAKLALLEVVARQHIFPNGGAKRGDDLQWVESVKNHHLNKSKWQNMQSNWLYLHMTLYQFFLTIVKLYLPCHFEDSGVL